MRKPPGKREKPLQLTPKEVIFVAEYQKDWNGTRAATEAGFSPRTAAAQAYQLLHKPLVKQALERAMEERLLKIGVTTERILTELARIAFSDLRKLYRKDGSMLAPSEWGDETAAVVAGLEVLEEFAGSGRDRGQIGFTKKVRVFDKVRALEILARNKGLLKEGGTNVQVGVIVNEIMAGSNLQDAPKRGISRK